MGYLDELDEIFHQVFHRLTVERIRWQAREMSPSQIYLLELLECRGPQKVSSLAEAMGTTLSAVTALVDKLSACGSVVRQRSDEDRRVVYIHITEKGRTCLQQFKQQRRNILERVYQGLSDEELQHLICIYRKILENLKLERANY